MRSHFIDYRVINLWEVEAELVFAKSLNALLPFVPILKGGNSAEIVQRALIELQQDSQLVELESLLGFFASFVLETEVVQQIMRWDMTVLRESPWYQEILSEGEKRGRQEGWQEGRQEGLQQQRSLILRLLSRKIGAIAPELASQVQLLSHQQIELLGEALLDFSAPTDLETWLREHQI